MQPDRVYIGLCMLVINRLGELNVHIWPVSLCKLLAATGKESHFIISDITAAVK